MFIFYNLVAYFYFHDFMLFFVLFLETFLVMNMVAVRAVELLTGAYSIIFRADAF